MTEMIAKLSKIPVVPVVVIKDAAKAVPLAEALYKGGLPCAEITLRTPQALEAIAAIKKALPDMLLGAGTVLTTQQVDQAVAAGATFMVSPGLNPVTVQYCLDKGIPIVPGVCTPTEVEAGLSLGLDTFKFFPAEAAGGANMVKALSGPYGNIKFMPTGGITPSNLQSYLSIPSVFACGGSWMVKDDLIDSGNFAKIEELTREAVSLTQNA